VHGKAALLAHGALLEEAENELAAMATMSRPLNRKRDTIKQESFYLL